MICERCNKFDPAARIVSFVEARSMDLCALCAREFQFFVRGNGVMNALLDKLDLQNFRERDVRYEIYDVLEMWLKEGRIKLFYVAHPVGLDHAKRQLNVANAKKWIAKLVEAVPDIGFVAPWLPYVEMLDEDKYRVRGIRDDLEALRRCDGIVAVGGQGMSSGMMAEWTKAGEWGLKRVNYSNRFLDRDVIPHDFIEGLE
jgi:hypothetical protein